jgi:hypothetical protein
MQSYERLAAAGGFCSEKLFFEGSYAILEEVFFLTKI